MKWTFSTNENPLHCAARKGHLEVVQVILENLNVVDFDDFNDFEASIEESANIAEFYGHEDVSEFVKNAWKIKGPKRKKLET